MGTTNSSWTSLGLGHGVAPTDMIGLGAKDAGGWVNCSFATHRSLDGVPPSVLPYFQEAAEQLVKDKGAVDVVASALAYISGAKEIVERSLLSAQPVSLSEGVGEPPDI